MAGVRAAAKSLLILKLRCPSCRRGNVCERSARGIWEESILPLVGIRPYVCQDCLVQFHRFPLQGNGRGKTRVPRRKRENSLRDVPPPEASSQKAFQELIAAIAEAERAHFGSVPEEGESVPSTALGHRIESDFEV